MDARAQIPVPEFRELFFLFSFILIVLQRKIKLIGSRKVTPFMTISPNIIPTEDVTAHICLLRSNI